MGTDVYNTASWACSQVVSFLCTCDDHSGRKFRDAKNPNKPKETPSHNVGVFDALLDTETNWDSYEIRQKKIRERMSHSVQGI